MINLILSVIALPLWLATMFLSSALALPQNEFESTEGNVYWFLLNIPSTIILVYTLVEVYKI